MTRRTCYRCSSPIKPSESASVVFCSYVCSIKQLSDPPRSWEVCTTGKDGSDVVVEFTSLANAEGAKRLIRQLGSAADVTIRPIYGDKNPDEVS
jgi:hypothetical protein